MGLKDKIANFLFGQVTKKSQEELKTKVRKDSDKLRAAERTQYLACAANEAAHSELAVQQDKSVNLTRAALQKMPTAKLPRPEDEADDVPALDPLDDTQELPPLARST